MPKKIDHQKRREQILHTSLEVFARQGYKDSNLSLIAQECGLSRPTVYQYFKDKSDIYYYAVKTTTEKMFLKYTSDTWPKTGDVVDQIILVCSDIMDTALEHKAEIINLVKAMNDMDVDFPNAVHHRTAKLQLFFRRLLREGITKGTVKNCNVNQTVLRIVILLESFCFQITYFDNDKKEARELVTDFIKSCRN